MEGKPLPEPWEETQRRDPFTQGQLAVRTTKDGQMGRHKMAAQIKGKLKFSNEFQVQWMKVNKSVYLASKRCVSRAVPLQFSAQLVLSVHDSSGMPRSFHPHHTLTLTHTTQTHDTDTDTHTHTHTARWQTELCVRLWGRLGVLRDGKVLSLGGTGKLGISVIEVLMVKEPKIGCVLSLWSHVPSYCLIDISLKRKWNTRCSNQNLHDISQLDNS